MILPDLAELVALRGAVQGLSLRAHRPAFAKLQGGHRSAQRGRGLEFDEVRLYAAGDDVRSIDWRVTARRGRPHTKVFVEDREQPVWLVADLHPGTFFGSRRQLKSALLLRAAAFLGWVAVSGGDRLGAVVVGADGGTRILPPRGRQAGILPVLEALVASQPRGPGLPAKQSLNAALILLRPLAKPGSLVVLLSDFAGLDGDTGVLLAAICAHCDCRLLRICDPLERMGLPAGEYRVGIPGRSWWLDGARTRDDWRSVWNARDAAVRDLAGRLAVPLTSLETPGSVSEMLPPLLREPRWAR